MCYVTDDVDSVLSEAMGNCRITEEVDKIVSEYMRENRNLEWLRWLW